jgi:hypothetical protein
VDFASLYPSNICAYHHKRSTSLVIVSDPASNSSGSIWMPSNPDMSIASPPSRSPRPTQSWRPFLTVAGTSSARAAVRGPVFYEYKPALSTPPQPQGGPLGDL